MSELIRIRVEGISKQYRLGEVGTGTLSHDLNRIWHKMRGKEDPYRQITESNDRTIEGDSGYVWALEDVNFEVAQGEVLGIIGKNGAGKSTLLKILSKVTGPTKGKIKINGRIAALLEVGTGMHPELTGKENIYLNGAILGMTRREIDTKFQEIVDFSGIAKYINTPFKRYSSGMRVRLGFAVAAFLEPEILIVDEVLAVGDAEFQRKAIGKMKEVSSGGRTVLFVSHNLEAVKNLCNRAILMEHGKVKSIGSPQEIIDEYLKKGNDLTWGNSWETHDSPGNSHLRILECGIRLPNNADGYSLITVRTSFDVLFEFELFEAVHLNLSLHLYAATGECVFACTTPIPTTILEPGIHQAVCRFPGDLLNTGIYTINCMFVKDATTILFNLEDQIVFEVNEDREKSEWHGKFPGVVRPKLDFIFKKNG